MNVGTRVRVHPRNNTGPGTGVGAVGTVEHIQELESSVTGMPLRWVSVDVRLDSGSLVTRQPSELCYIYE